MKQSFTALAAPPPVFRYTGDMNAIPDKRALRAHMRALRAHLKAARPDAGVLAAERLPLEALPPFATFAGYVACGSEIDPLPLMQRLAEAGARPALPVAERLEAALEFRAWDRGSPLQPDAFGIPAPAPSAAVVAPDLVIAPLLAFDRRGGRLGQGAGHYDRSLADLRRTRRVFVLGLAYAGQELAEIPLEAHDQRLDAILTETEFIPVARES